jgi:hypothetical protein
MITYSDFTKIIQSVRNICLRKYPNDIDTLSPEERNSRLEIIQQDDLFTKLSFSIRHAFIYQIQELITSPRLLKMVLRRTYHAWSILHGEIDFDDVFVVNVLRFAAPEAYDFLLNNVNEIRGLESDSAYDKFEAKKEKLQKKWNRATENVDWNVTATETLISFLFPYWESGHSRFKIVPQGIANSHPTDYWVRANSEDLSQSEIKDQEILQAIKGGMSDSNETPFRNLKLPEALFKFPDISSKFEHLAKKIIDGESIRKIAEDLFKLILENKKSAANQKDCPAYLSLWRLSLDKPIKKEDHQRWILNEILKALPISLYFANELYYYWRIHERTYVEFEEPCPEVRNPMVEKAKELYDGSPETLIIVIEGNPPNSVDQFAILFSQPRYGGPGFNPEEWRWLANTLLDAASLQPGESLIQIISLIFNDTRTTNGYKYVFNEELAKSLFEKRLSEVMKLLAQDFEYKHLKKREQEKIVFARQTAIQWLAKYKSD